mmetsp:Transcript_79929/g.235117  ORF Transcript_79929/g.235117 Transcript_79929/m.235117 type:complete len:340 (+) Transcript_79929:1035-2054(+)
MPKRKARLIPLKLDGPKVVSILVDPEASKEYEQLVDEARDKSRTFYERRFYKSELKDLKHLALLVGSSCSQVLGYCVYCTNTNRQWELQVEQLVCVDRVLKNAFQAWLSSEAAASGQTLVIEQSEPYTGRRIPLSEIRRRASMDQPEVPAFWVLSNAGAELRETREEKGPPYCLLPKGVPLFGEPTRQGTVEVKWPVAGCFVDRSALGELHSGAAIERKSMGAAELFAVMHRIRQEVARPSSRGQCVLASNYLHQDIKEYEIDRQLGQGGCRIVEGSFHAKSDGIGNWEKHWYVMFDDNSIADVTADQFDDVIKLWWPADPKRYAIWERGRQVNVTAEY